MYDDLVGKTALITGASSGLGLHFAHVLAGRGVHVILAARRLSALDDAQRGIEAAGFAARVIEMDVTDRASVERAVAKIEPEIDILVNNAGYNVPVRALEMEEADWDRVLDTNLKGVFLVAQAVGKRMENVGLGGTIVNIASILGLRAAGDLAAYSASKAAVVQLTKTLALEWARFGIRVNTLCPGYFENEQYEAFFTSEAGEALIKRIPLRRLGKPAELDAPILLLCSDVGSYITGSVLVVDGGDLVS